MGVRSLASTPLLIPGLAFYHPKVAVAKRSYGLIPTTLIILPVLPFSAR